MKQPEMPYCFIACNKYIIGTPKGIAKSKQTIDMSFEEFAANTELQKKLELLCSILADPSILHATRSTEKEIAEGVAVYLASFASNLKEEDARKNYLLSNGTVRLLVRDEQLLKEINHSGMES
ncbi:hypothetical protein JXB11_02385 [Candidatus Woesearchaeota archaeon]|nr:hypothetical protein [Candidatus Woesearchaeota archaeon]